MFRLNHRKYIKISPTSSHFPQVAHNCKILLINIILSLRESEEMNGVVPCFVCVIATITSFCGTLLWTRNIINWGEQTLNTHTFHKKSVQASAKKRKSSAYLQITLSVIGNSVEMIRKVGLDSRLIKILFSSFI